MKTPPATVMSVSALPAAIFAMMRKTSEFFRKLSLNAEKNWVQNSAAKRRAERSLSIVVTPERGRRVVCDGSDVGAGDFAQEALGFCVVDAIGHA